MPLAVPSLDDYLNEDDLFVVSQGRGKPSSIRDQINKATWLIEHAKAARRINRGEVLLILGAGAAGVSAAWKAVTLGINVVLYEFKAAAFPVQAACETRWLHPNEYLWPLPGCQQEHYPLDSEAKAAPPMLKWSADRPCEVAARWREQFAAWAGRHEQEDYPNGYLAWLPGMHREFADRADLRQHVREKFAEGACQMVLLCVGAEERGVAGSQHRSYRFWDSDPYETLHYGLPSLPPTGLRTLVSGGGDGALQDFLRIACQRPGAARPVQVLGLLKPLLHLLDRCPAYQPVKAAFQRWDETCHRPDPAALWAVLEKFVDELTTTPQAAEIAGHLRHVIDPELAAGRKVLHLNLAEGRFEQCFALNALLVRLFEWFLRQQGQATAFQPRAFIRAVNSDSVAHRCSADPVTGAGDCLLNPHRVAFHPNPSGTAVAERTYDVVVIRHGIEPLA